MNQSYSFFELPSERGRPKACLTSGARRGIKKYTQKFPSIPGYILFKKIPFLRGFLTLGGRVCRSLYQRYMPFRKNPFLRGFLTFGGRVCRSLYHGHRPFRKNSFLRGFLTLGVRVCRTLRKTHAVQKKNPF